MSFNINVYVTYEIRMNIKFFFHDLRCNSKKVPYKYADFDSVNFRSLLSFAVWKIKFEILQFFIFITIILLLIFFNN